MSDQARLALALVMIFAVAFVSVIGLKIIQERRDLVHEAEVVHGRSATFLADHASARLLRAKGAVDSMADAVGLVPADQAPGLLAYLAAESLIVEAAVIGADGQVLAESRLETGGDLARAAGEASGRPLWVAGLDGSAARIFTAAPLPDDRGLLVAEIDAAAAAPFKARDGEVIALADAQGAILAVSSSLGAPALGDAASQAFTVDFGGLQAESEDGGGIRRARLAGQKIALSAAPVRDLDRAVSERSGLGLTMLYGAPLDLRGELWRSTLLFYLLLLSAPILVSIGLCAVLLMQMANIRQARAALQDQERRFRVAIESARCGVWDWNLADDTVFITDSLASMFGRKGATTMKGQEFVSLVRAQDQEKFAEAIRNAPTTGEVDVEFRAYSLPVWLHARGRPWTPAGGTTGRVVGVAIDVTEQKGAQARVAAAETRLRAALESVSECFVLWDARRRLVLSNQKYREFFNLDTKLVKPGAAYEMLELATQSAIKATHPSTDEGARELELADGRWIHFSERRTNDGGLVSIGTDITALKRQETLLVEREKQAREAQARITDLARNYEQEKIKAQEANRSKSEFLANMSHELRTPLNAINGFSEIMVQEMFGALGDARYKEYAQDILSSGQLLLALINDILDMSKIEAGKLKLSLEEVQPHDIAEQCARLVRGRARDADLDFIVDVNEMPTIKADPRALKQVLLNLATNAIKFTPEGGRVVLEGRGLSTGVRFRVTDTGIGISSKDLQRIGKPFEQIESQQSKSHQGSGLGLALSRSLVELHGGKLTIESEVGKGTTVTFTLPLDAEAAVKEELAAAKTTMRLYEPT